MSQLSGRVCRYLHWTICKEYGIKTKPVWEHKNQPITAIDNVNIFYDKPIVLGRYIEEGAIKPDIVVWDKAKKSAKVIEVTVRNDYGLNRAEQEKLMKYQDLKNDLRTTWELEDICIIPVVVGATGLVMTNLQNYLKSIPGTPSCDEVQLSAI